jgi:hypothetical protein
MQVAWTCAIVTVTEVSKNPALSRAALRWSHSVRAGHSAPQCLGCTHRWGSLHSNPPTVLFIARADGASPDSALVAALCEECEASDYVPGVAEDWLKSLCEGDVSPAVLGCAGSA